MNKTDVNEDTMVILVFPNYKWIGPKRLLPRQHISQDNNRFIMSVSASDRSRQQINIAFTRIHHLKSINETTTSIEMYRPAIKTARHILARLDVTFGKNKLWRKVKSELALNDAQRLIGL